MKTLDEGLIRQLVQEILAQLPAGGGFYPPEALPVGISARHVHLSVKDLKVLFGTTYLLQKLKDLKQPGQFAAKETVTLVGPKGTLRGVRILGPERKQTQVEISRTDGFALGIEPPIRHSGKLKGSAGIVMVGPHGAVTLEEGVIIAARHLHLSPADGTVLNLKDKDVILLESSGVRGLQFNEVLVRCGPAHLTEFHLDTDEANAGDLENGTLVKIIR